jgi:hypothetical protein
VFKQVMLMVMMMVMMAMMMVTMIMMLDRSDFYKRFSVRSRLLIGQGDLLCVRANGSWKDVHNDGRRPAGDV